MTDRFGIDREPNLEESLSDRLRATEESGELDLARPDSGGSEPTRPTDTAEPAPKEFNVVLPPLDLAAGGYERQPGRPSPELVVVGQEPRPGRQSSDRTVNLIFAEPGELRGGVFTGFHPDLADRTLAEIVEPFSDLLDIIGSNERVTDLDPRERLPLAERFREIGIDVGTDRTFAQAYASVRVAMYLMAGRIGQR